MKTLHPDLGTVFGSMELELPKILTADSWGDELRLLDTLRGGDVGEWRSGKESRRAALPLQPKYQSPEKLIAGPKKALDGIAARVEEPAKKLAERRVHVADTAGATRPISEDDLVHTID